MRIKHIVNPFVSDDTAGECVLFGQLDTSKVQQTIDSMTRMTSGKFSIGVSSSENLPFGDVNDVRAVYVRADGDFNVVFNGGVDSLAIKRASIATGAKATMFLEIDTTQVALTNPSATVALTGTYVVWGDVAA